MRVRVKVKVWWRRRGSAQRRRMPEHRDTEGGSVRVRGRVRVRVRVRFRVAWPPTTYLVRGQGQG